jgi:hypothetical protein
MNTGLGNVNVVATLASVLVVTADGFIDTSEKGKLFVDG